MGARTKRRSQAAPGEDAIPDTPAKPRVSLHELAFVFLKLGTIAFGGPAAHLAMMEEEFVRKRRWITQAEFLDRLAAANLIPGPSSTEVAIFIGQSLRGWAGLMVAGTCFIFPAAILVEDDRGGICTVWGVATDGRNSGGDQACSNCDYRAGAVEAGAECGQDENSGCDWSRFGRA